MYKNDNHIMFEDLTTKAYKKIKDMIISGELKPGEKLNQEKLAKQLGISRTPLLQALRRLSSEQLTQTIPRRGSRVKIFTKEDLLSIFEIRGKLEPYICELSAKFITEEQIEELKENIENMKLSIGEDNKIKFKTLDNQFHSIIIKSSKDNIISDILNKYIPLMYSIDILKPMEKILEDHKNILDLLISKDSFSASQLMHYHIYTSTKNNLINVLNQRE
ncbi:MAG: GntR family transcriptional regulator [Pleomorphochaeta sp.]